MSNLKMYQPKYKEKYLSNYENNTTKRMYEWLFDKSFEFETKFGKDLFDFSLDELKEFMTSRKFNRATAEYFLRRISGYIDWTMDQGIKRINKNYISDEGFDKLSKEFARVSTDYFRYDEILEIVDAVDEADRKYFFPELKNEQDKLLVYLLFWGARHGDKLHELTNLKFSDVDFDNRQIKLTNLDGEERYLKVDTHCLNLIRKSKSETKYYRYGNLKSKNNVEFYPLIKSDYIFRRSEVGNKGKDEEYITYQTLRKRVVTIGEYLGINLNPKTLHKSGLLFAVKYMMDKGIKVNVDNAERIIFDRYRGYSMYQTKSKLLKEMRELVPEIYNEEISGGM